MTSKQIELRAAVLSPGTVTGKLLFLGPTTPGESLARVRVLAADEELARVERAVEFLKRDLGAAALLLRRESLREEAEIIQTHVSILEDPELGAGIRERIRCHGEAAEGAVEHVLGKTIAVLAASESPLLAERAGDVKDLMMRLKNTLREDGQTLPRLLRDRLDAVSSPVMVAEELLPSLVLEARTLRGAGFIVAAGTALSHAAILARSFGIPAVRIERRHHRLLAPGRPVRLDALKGVVVLEPREETVSSPTAGKSSAGGRGSGRIPVRLWLNVAEPDQIRPQTLQTAAGVGLYRTEFLFMGCDHGFPDEETQYETYARLFRRCGDRPVTVRTLDIGGDKDLGYFSFGPQRNPFLGLRAHRLFRYHPEIPHTQLRAILRAAAQGTDLRLLYPMVETTDELLYLQSLLDRARESLRKEGAEFCGEYRQGVLIEVPSAVWCFEDLLRRVDFASIGTNDLLQYFFAVDRNSANVAGVCQPRHPAVLRMLKGMLDTAARLRKPLGICGELASDPGYLPLLLGLGFEDLSVDVHAIDSLRELIAAADPGKLKELSARCLRASTAAEVGWVLQEAGAVPEALAEEDASLSTEENIDPICGMIVHTEGNALHLETPGGRYFFCSPACLRRFAVTARQE